MTRKFLILSVDTKKKISSKQSSINGYWDVVSILYTLHIIAFNFWEFASEKNIMALGIGFLMSLSLNYREVIYELENNDCLNKKSS